MEAKLICIDFDYTLVKGHFHNTLVRQGVIPGQALASDIESLINDFGFKNKKETLAVMRRILKEGHKLAITSYTSYPEIVKPTLKALGLNDDELNKIEVIGGFPTVDGMLECGKSMSIDMSKGKSLHIKEAIKKFNLNDILPKNIILVDDSLKNISCANDSGQVGLKVPAGAQEGGDYLKILVTKLDEALKDELQSIKTIIPGDKKNKPTVDFFKKNYIDPPKVKKSPTPKKVEEKTFVAVKKIKNVSVEKEKGYINDKDAKIQRDYFEKHFIKKEPKPAKKKRQRKE